MPHAHPPSGSSLLEDLLLVAREAGRAIMEIYASAFVVRGKEDESPVTDADLAAEAVIVKALAQLTPDIPIVAEEQMSTGHAPALKRSFWLIDPLDGTREFVKRNGEFTVNIGLIYDSLPVLGIVYAPAIDRLFAGVYDAQNGASEASSEASTCAFEERSGKRANIRCRPVPALDLIVACSRSHGREHDLDVFLQPWQVIDRVRIGSSLKFGLIAAGEADLYPRLSPTMEWDTAAGHAVIRAAGGAVTDPQGAELRYGKTAFRNGHFVAWGQRNQTQRSNP